MAVGVLQQAVQRRTPGFGAGDSVVGVLVDNLKTALTSETTKLIQLSLWVLVQRGHSDVERSSLHANTSSRA
jgi:hypothetical protein